MHSVFARCLLCVIFVGVVGCSSDAGPDMVESPAGSGSGQPRLYAAEDGTIWMSWIASVEDGHALRYATFDGTQWSDPATVATGNDWFVNWADLPSVRPLPGGRLAAHYLASSGPSALAYDVRIQQTTASGRWQKAVTPHRDGTKTEHGFVSLLPWTNDRVLAVWLDGRKTETGKEGHGGGEMTLRSAVIGADGSVERRSLVDGRTCECCATSAVRTGGEALVAYRDRSEDEIRDINLVRFDGETWTEPTRLHEDGWQIEGCPVNGPALAADGDRVVATWFTAAGGRPRVKAAFSDDGGRTFGDPIVVQDGATKGRVDAVLVEDGSAVVSWLGTEETEAVIHGRLVRPDDTAPPAVTMATPPSASRAVGFPKMVHSKGQIYVAWVDPADSSSASHVRLERVPVSSLK